MTIDEAIARERQHAKDKRKEMQCKTCKLFARSDLHPLQGYCRKNEFRSIEIDSWRKVCSEYVPKEMCKCAEEHEQLAEWLEELKAIKEMDLSIPQHFTKEQSDWIKAYCIKRNIEFYNKAIDDFAEKVIQRYHELPTTLGYTEEIVKEIAEQLKAGGENERK